MTINLIGAKGGVGTSTIAVALAIATGGTAVAVTIDGAADLRAIAGMNQEPDIAVNFGDGPNVVDLGSTLPDERPDGILVAVVRGPDYVGLRRLLNFPESLRPDGVIVVTEPGRALNAADVEATTSLPVLADIPWDPAVARAVDAGLLMSRMPRSIAGLADALGVLV